MTRAHLTRRFVRPCLLCGALTQKKYAREHEGRCKACATGETDAAVPTRNERIIEHGYEAYAREEGHYDGPDA